MEINMKNPIYINLYFPKEKKNRYINASRIASFRKITPDTDFPMEYCGLTYIRWFDNFNEPIKNGITTYSVHDIDDAIRYGELNG
jgi:hypothetical protein